MDEFIVDFNFMRPGGRTCVCVPNVYAIRFTIKRNIYEFTRTNFIISILVKDPIHLARFALDSFVCCVCFFYVTTNIAFVITFVVRLMHFSVLLFQIYIKSVCMGIRKMTMTIRDKTSKIKFVLSILLRCTQKEYLKWEKSSFFSNREFVSLFFSPVFSRVFLSVVHTRFQYSTC